MKIGSFCRDTGTSDRIERARVRKFPIRKISGDPQLSGLTGFGGLLREFGIDRLIGKPTGVTKDVEDTSIKFLD